MDIGSWIARTASQRRRPLILSGCHVLEGMRSRPSRSNRNGAEPPLSLRQMAPEENRPSLEVDGEWIG